MFELVQVGEKSYYIESPAKIGVYKQSETEVYLIDTGNDKDAGRKIRKIFDENGWTLKGIINTHSNADHIGGNRYLQQQFNCKVFSGGIEKAFTEHTLLEPSFLYGGYPFKELRHKFLIAEESAVTDFSDESFPKELEIIPLPGHFFDMVGIRTPDNTVFLADCISSKSTLEKYQLAFIYDVKSYLETLDKVKGLSAEILVPSHAQAEKDLGELIDFNRSKVYEIANSILSICAKPRNFEEILKLLFDRYNLTMSFEQYVLVGSTLRSYLSWLKDSDKLGTIFEGNYFYWLQK